jgi:hypothetical protein
MHIQHINISKILDFVGCTKAVMTWFHAAHHVSKGTGFAGDHVSLYGEIYEEIIEDFDKLVEKSIMLCDNEDVACPTKITHASLKYLQQFESPCNKNGDTISVLGLDVIRHHISHLEHIYNYLESCNALSLGMDDYLAASANQYEGYEYLLSQRTKRGY